MIVGIIPARYASTRLAAKPLCDIGGKPMIQHTYESALRSKLLNKVVIATDDVRILETAEKFGAEVFLTPSEIQTGSDRIAYVAKKMRDCATIVNIQGDEPFIPGKMIDQAIEPLLFDKNVKISTLVKKIKTQTELKSPSVVKVVFDYENYALYFSRSPIPFVREGKNVLERFNATTFYKHIGLYAYRKEYLLKFTSLEPTELENLEKLEQLRLLENGYKIKVVETELESISVDTAADLNRARIFYSLHESRN